MVFTKKFWKENRKELVNKLKIGAQHRIIHGHKGCKHLDKTKKIIAEKTRIYLISLGDKHPSRRIITRKKISDSIKEYYKNGNAPFGFKKGTKIWEKSFSNHKQTKGETYMEYGLKSLNIKYKKQKVIKIKKKNKKYVVDFFIKPNIIIECDGEFWHNFPFGKENDKKRDLQLKKEGYNTIRFWNNQIIFNRHGCARLIKGAMEIDT